MEVRDLRRYPQLDGFKGNLRRWQLANGWRWECQRCGKPCVGQEEGEPDSDGPFAVLDDEDHVFCSASCRDTYGAYWAHHHAVDTAVREDFERAHPGVQIVSVYHNDWGGYVNAGAPLNQTVTVWEMVTVIKQHWPASRVVFYRNTEP